MWEKGIVGTHGTRKMRTLQMRRNYGVSSGLVYKSGMGHARIGT